MRNPLLSALVLGSVALAASCYNPDVKNGAFSCSKDLGNACPGGFICSGGLCIKPTAQDMAISPLDLSGDQAVVPFVPTCDDFIAQGQFMNLVPLTALNTAADETHLALNSNGTSWSLLFVRSGALYSSALSGANHKTAAAPTPVTLTGGPTTVNGGSFTSDGTLWFAGTTGSTTTLYSATSTGAAAFTTTPLAAPISTGCAFSDPVFYKGVAANDMSVGLEMYAAFPLAGCSGPSYVVLGAEGRNIGGFVSALPNYGWASPSLTPTGDGLIVASTATPPALSIGRRSAVGFQFDSVQPIPMTAIGTSSGGDYQAVVSSDCSEIYFASNRAGGQGGVDIYAADVVQQ